LKYHKEIEADAIGMSGLLVKSTQVMRDNLKELEKRGINVPILMGGAALTRGFVDDYCRPIYSGAIFYCRDAFDGVIAMSRIEEWKKDKSKPLDTRLQGDLAQGEKKEKKKKSVVIPPFEQIKIPSQVKIPTPPFWGQRVMNKKSFSPEIAFEWINKRMLFKMHWGYKSKGLSKSEYQKILNDKVYPAFERLKDEFLDKKLFEPIIIYGYYPCRAKDTELYIFEPESGWSDRFPPNEEPFELRVKDSLYSFKFPRQRKKPHRALSDFFRGDRDDVVALTCVSVGEKISEYEREIYEKGEYLEYNLIHGLGVELAEALAEIAHKQIRLDLNIIKDDEGVTLKDVRVNRYQGARYSFGYPACPDLEQNRVLFDILKPEEFGITLSETFQMHPEQTTSAIVVHHQEATYYTV